MSVPKIGRRGPQAPIFRVREAGNGHPPPVPPTEADEFMPPPGTPDGVVRALYLVCLCCATELTGKDPRQRRCEACQHGWHIPSTTRWTLYDEVKWLATFPTEQADRIMNRRTWCLCGVNMLRRSHVRTALRAAYAAQEATE